jgi:tetratricopeptide (TPR) repeat protein
MGENKLLDTPDKTKIDGINNTSFAASFVIDPKKPLKLPFRQVLSRNPASCEKALDSCFRRNDTIKKLNSIFYLTIILFLNILCACTFPRIIVLDDPLSPEEHLNLGVTYEKNGELDNALKEYEKASKKLPVAYFYIGNIYFQKDEFDEAESHYKKAISKDPNNADVYNNLAWLYYIKRENLDEAERLALKAIELNPARMDIYQDTLERIRGLKNPK